MPGPGSIRGRAVAIPASAHRPGPARQPTRACCRPAPAPPADPRPPLPACVPRTPAAPSLRRLRAAAATSLLPSGAGFAAAPSAPAVAALPAAELVRSGGPPPPPPPAAAGGFGAPATAAGLAAGAGAPPLEALAARWLSCESATGFLIGVVSEYETRDSTLGATIHFVATFLHIHMPTQQDGRIVIDFTNDWAYRQHHCGKALSSFTVDWVYYAHL